MGRLTLSILLFASLSGIGCFEKPKGSESEINVYAAASLSDVIRKLANAFEAETSIHITLNFASSGALANQIIAAQRADVFLSANQEWLNLLEDKALVDPADCKVFAQNSLVVVAVNEYDLGASDGLMHLCQGEYNYLAIGAPEFVPAGSYAKKWLQQKVCSVDGDLWNHVESKLVRAPDAKAISSYVISSKEVIGIVYMTDYIDASEQLKIIYHIPSEETAQIEYSAAVLSGSASTDAANMFVNYLQGAKGSYALAQHGFILPSVDD